MFGFYDPQSLKVDGNTASIKFIEAVTGAEQDVEIADRKTAEMISGALDDQVKHAIAALDARIVSLQGPLSFSDMDNGEAILHPTDNPGKMVPVKLDFEPPQDGFMPQGYSMVKGVFRDGALIATSVLMRGPAPSHEKRQSVETTLN